MRAVPGRVAHLTTVDSTLWFMLRAQLEAVNEAGGESLAISAPGPWVDELERAGVRHRSLPASTRAANLGADLRAVVQLWRVLREERPEILHTHNPKPGLYGRIVGRLAGVPIVVNTVHGLYATDRDPWLRRLVVYGLEAIAARFSDADLVQSREDLTLMTRWRLTPPARAHLLGNGVDLERFDPARLTDRDRARTRASLGARDDQIVVGMVGRLVAEKGYPELVEATELLDERFVVVVAGPDDPAKRDRLSEAFRRRAERTGVRVLGFTPDVERLYHAMDMFVLPSHREGVPRAAMEAAAMGLPVIATDIRGCREVVTPERTGLLVPVGDVRRLVAAISRLGDDEVLRRRLAAAARADALERFDEHAVVERVLQTYRRLSVEKGFRPIGTTAPRR